VVDTGEECDDGNRRDFDGCGATCFWERGVCGDGIVQQAFGEQCEPGVASSSGDYRCSNTCQRVLLACGNGQLDAGEICDEGAGNSRLPNALCRPDCTRSRCGDLVIDSGEQCDDGDLVPGDGCDRSCIREPFGPIIAGPVGSIPFPGGSGSSFLARLLPLNFRPAAPEGPAPEGTPATGPVAVAVMAAGAAAGVAWLRRRR
jgi:cysteine-rich repeat protein